MKSLSDKSLIAAYYEAKRLGLSLEFIKLLKKEIDIRGLPVEQKRP